MNDEQPQGLQDADRILAGRIYDPDQRRRTERTVLSAATYYGRLTEVVDGLTEEMFSYPNHRKIFRALAALAGEGREEVDLVAINDKLADLGEQCADPVSLIDATGIDIRACDRHMRVLRAHYANRKATEYLNDAAVRLSDGRDIFEVIHDLEAKTDTLRAIGEKTAPPDYTLLDAVLDAEAEAADPSPKVETTFGALDHALGGGLGAGLFVVGASPSTGKSALALQLALAALRQDRQVAYFSLEMSGCEIGQRILAALGSLSGEERELLRRAHFSTSASLPAITSGIERHLRGRGPGVAVVDYLQLTDRPDDRVPETQFLGQVTRRLKLISQELSIPVILLSQLNRSSRNEGRAPTPADLRGSGCIEQDANQVLLMWRDLDDERRTGPNGDRVTHFNLAKCRNGSPCSFDALFDPARMRFTEVGGRAYGRNGR